MRSTHKPALIFVPPAPAPVSVTPLSVYLQCLYSREACTLVLASLVVALGAVVAGTPVIPTFASNIAALIEQTSIGFHELVAPIPGYLATRLSAGHTSAEVAHESAMGQVASATEHLVSPELSYTRLSLDVPLTGHLAHVPPPSTAVPMKAGEWLPALRQALRGDALRAFIVGNYVAIGQGGYHGAVWLLDIYPRFIAATGNKIFVLTTTYLVSV